MKILCIRLSAIGDIVMASPLIKSLRVRYPDAYIAWLVQSETSELLTANPLLDEVIVWPRGDWRRLWRNMRWLKLAREIRNFTGQLRARHFDIVIDLQGLLKSGIWARLTGAPLRIGLGSKEGSRLLMNQIIDKPGDDDRIGPEYRHLAHSLGLDYSEFDMDVALTDEDQRYAAQIIEDNGLASGFIVVCPFTTRPQKHWVEDRWTALAQRMHTEFGARTIILGGPDNRETAASIAANCQDTVTNLAGRTRLRQAAALIGRASLLVGVDTGLTHMGIMFNIPTIAIFGSTRPYLETEHNNTVIIYKQLECSPCGRNPTCGGAFTCMTSVSVDEVMANAARLLRKV
jgi:heptosyltransferase-1